MRTDKRTAENVWQCIDLMTEYCIGWYPDEMSARKDNRGKGVTVWYRPGKKRVKR